MKVIVTGGAGFVGSHLVELLISKGHFPIIVDNLSTGKAKYIKDFVNSSQAKFFKIDIRNFNDIMKIPLADAVIHLAAIASVVESIKNPSYVNDVNVNGTLNMLEFCRKKRIKRFVLASSAAIFGDYEKRISETTKAYPTTIYGSTKLTCEHYCRIYSKLFKMTTVALRPFNIYGPRQNNAYAGVISKFMSRINSNKPPIIHGDGKQTRDFIHVKDVARAFERALHYNKEKFDVFNLATGKSISINNLCRLFLVLSNKDHLRSIHKKAVAGVVIHSSANIHKITKVLGFSTSVKLEDGIRTLLHST